MANTVEDYITAYEASGSIAEVARQFGVSRSNVQRSLRRAGYRPSPAFNGTSGGEKTDILSLPTKGVRRYLVTSAQANTRVYGPFWTNLQALAAHYKADVLVAPWTYNPVTDRSEDDEPAWAAELTPYLVERRTQLAPGLVFCAELSRILPTAARPLSGFETYTGRASSIIPHAKIAMESVASLIDEPTKFLYTTGTVTRHNYSRTKAGFKGEFHHAYGALVVEVTPDGSWWVRQLNADSAGRIYDLDVCAAGGEVTTGHSAEALVMGDVHVAEINDDVLQATWGAKGLVDAMQPKVQVLHDVFDMRARPWQDEANFHRQYEKYVNGQESVSEEVDQARDVLQNIIMRPYAKTVIVRSNHDLKLEKWLNTADYRRDLVNARFFLEAQLAKVDAIENNQRKFKVLEWALAIPDAQFLDEDESFVLCRRNGGGIECGMHGHLGPNGSHGTPRGLTKLARKTIIGDKHCAGIYDGVYVVGTCTLRPAYVKGPSAWSPTHCIVYPNGKRALLTMWQGAFFAPRSSTAKS